MKLKPGDPAYTDRVMARQTSIVASIMSTTAKVNDSTLRGKGRDRLAEILGAIAAEERKN